MSKKAEKLAAGFGALPKPPKKEINESAAKSFEAGAAAPLVDGAPALDPASVAKPTKARVVSMGRSKRSLSAVQRLSVLLPDETAEKLRAHCTAHRLSMSDGITRAVEAWIKSES